MSSPTSTYLMRPEDFLSTVSVAPQEPFPSYPMKQPPGHALIINIQTFSGRTPQGLVLNERKGTQVDLDNLTDLWKQLGFVVQKHTDLKAHQIFTVVQDLAKAIDNSASCFVCCIMTHGMLGSIYGSDSNPVKIGDITGFFKEKQCKALAGKPKLFFIQACRGQNKLSHDSLSTGMPETNLHPDATPTDEDKQDESFRHSADPNESHFLLGYATPPGKCI